MKTVAIYTDGACSGNPGPGGWGAILEYNGHERTLSGGAPETTNNRMELTAVIEALKKLKEPCVVELYSDSLHGFTTEKVVADLHPGYTARRFYTPDMQVQHILPTLPPYWRSTN